jgi:uracil-DNA glycosylase
VAATEGADRGQVPGPGTLSALDRLEAAVTECRLCPRLVAWREEVAVVKRAAFRDQTYWGRPMQGFGDPGARVLVLGLAPAAHGGNRTGRIFTGDRSGDWLFAALWRAGFANQPESVSRDDGLTLTDCWVTAAVRCAPPVNKPTPTERDTCTTTWLVPELALLARKRVIVCLGGFAWDAAMRTLSAPRPRRSFGHGVEARLDDHLTLLASYHVSQQNTFTGRLTEPMLDAVFARARELAVA